MNIERKLTLGCMAFAGLIIIPSILFNKPIIALFGIIIDILPMVFGWFRRAMMSISFPVAFGIIAIFGYLFFVIWLFAPRVIALRTLFAEFYFLSVIARIE
ncbi:MAG: hypothetical protein GWP10_18385 [Nitrospiraceae bacterium]|nr:hypothetical protein [Nitrospiraceae bacterium]